MRKNLRKFASSRTLLIFDAAARLGSFTQAAEELRIRQPAVSAAIRQLEQGLGVSLFTRSHRKVELTIAGRRLFSDVSEALDDIEASLRAVRQMGSNEHITLNCSSAFANYWMMPRLGAFHQAHPDIDLRLQISDRDPDLEEENISLGIRIGDGNWPGVEGVRLAEEVIFPVASPLVMASSKTLRSLPNMLHQRLIHLEEPIRKRPDWSDWFAYHDIRDAHVPSGLRLNDYALVLQAAISGEGFAFGWRHIVQNLIETGVLIGKEDWAWTTGNGIYLIWARRTPLLPHAEQVRDWIVEAAK